MKLFVWDFHGVLEKGNDHGVVEISNAALKKHGYSRRMTMEEGELLAGRRWYEYFSYLLPDLEHQEYLNLQATCFGMSENQPEVWTKYITLNDHAELVLQEIVKSGHTQILVSNTTPTALDLFIDAVGIRDYFPPTHRFGVDSHSQKHTTKKDCLKNYLQDKHFPLGIVSIGDSPGDMSLIEDHPKGVGYLYTHPNRVHRESACHYKIHDLRAVLQEICQF